jgi:hypothetical protein
MTADLLHIVKKHEIDPGLNVEAEVESVRCHCLPRRRPSIERIRPMLS